MAFFKPPEITLDFLVNGTNPVIGSGVFIMDGRIIQPYPVANKKDTGISNALYNYSTLLTLSGKIDTSPKVSFSMNAANRNTYISVEF